MNFSVSITLNLFLNQILDEQFGDNDAVNIDATATGDVHDNILEIEARHQSHTFTEQDLLNTNQNQPLADSTPNVTSSLNNAIIDIDQSIGWKEQSNSTSNGSHFNQPVQRMNVPMENGKGLTNTANELDTPQQSMANANDGIQLPIAVAVKIIPHNGQHIQTNVLSESAAEKCLQTNRADVRVSKIQKRLQNGHKQANGQDTPISVNAEVIDLISNNEDEGVSCIETSTRRNAESVANRSQPTRYVSVSMFDMSSRILR